MNKVVVEYDYTAKATDELTIKKGDVITDVIKKPGGWWEGTLKDKKGMFPDNFVRSMDKDSSVLLRNQDDVKRIRKCRVIFSYNQDHEDELNLKVGDIIDIVGEEEEGWWRGTLNGKEGVFPCNFVKELVWQPSPTSRDGRTSLSEKENFGKPALPIKPAKKLCEATFPYKAQNEDELSFNEGDIITLLNKDSLDPGWWQGELNGKIGVFPDNFVVVLSDSKETNKENKLVTDKGAVKSTSVASQRKSLEIKNNVVDSEGSNVLNSIRIQKKSITPPKKITSPSEAAFEIKRRSQDGVDGAVKSKVVINSNDDVKNNDTDAFDKIERKPLLNDIRATRPKAPGRRPPTVLYKDDSSSTTNENNDIPTDEGKFDIKPHLRYWEKHKAPWVEEMKSNQAKKALISSAVEDNKPKNDNLEMDIPRPTSLTQDTYKLTKDTEKHIFHKSQIRRPVVNNVKDIPDDSNDVKNTSKESSLSASPLAAKSPLSDNYKHILERICRLEETVKEQNNIIEELRNKLQIESDLRRLLQEKIDKL